MSIIEEAKKNLGPKPVTVNRYPDRFYSKENYCHPDKWIGVLEGNHG
jgi:hypothetical protein